MEPDNYTPKEDLEFIPVTDPGGFFRVYEYTGGQFSSCAMLVRSCYQAAGALNLFFLSLYPPSTAVGLLQAIGAMRNYRWVSEDSENYDPTAPPDGKRAIINDLYSLVKDENGNLTPTPRTADTLLGYTFNNEPMTAGKLKIYLAKVAGEKSKYNDAYNTAAKDKDIVLSNQRIKLINDWSINITPGGEESPSGEDQKFLKFYLKPREERAHLFSKDIGYMLYKPEDPKTGFPALEKGDAMLIIKTGATQPGGDQNKIINGGEHALMIGNNTKGGYAHNEKNELTYPIIGIEGGAMDDDNKKPVKGEKAEFIKKENVIGILDAARAGDPFSKNYVETKISLSDL